MRSRTLLPACLLLLWIMTASVSCNEAQKKLPELKVKALSDAIELDCNAQSSEITMPDKQSTSSPLKLVYSDENSGKYTCHYGDKVQTIFVKFRTCDNCVELDVAAITGIAVGSLVATAVIGVAVYLTASQNQTAPVPATKKRSDKQRLVPNEATQNDPNYQPLMHKGGQMYDVLTNRR